MITAFPPKEIWDDWEATTGIDSWVWREDLTLPRPPPRDAQVQDHHLSLQLGDCQDYGRSGIVFEAKPTGFNRFTSLPDLVVKVARPTRCMSNAREAWFYDYLQCLQGVALPRCYGWFELEIPQDSGWEIPAWSSYPVDDDSDDAAEGPPEFMNLDEEEVIRHKLVPHSTLTELANTRNRVLVLLLERVGEHVTWTRTLEADLTALYREFALLGVDLTKDIKIDNVLQAPTSPNSYPTLASPLTQLKHKHRVIDLELAILSYCTERDILFRNWDFIHVICLNAPPKET